MDQLTGSSPLIAMSCLPSRPNELARERIAVRQVWHAMPPQDRADGAWRDAQLGADPVWPSALIAPQPKHLCFDIVSGSGR
jgi:hypothetical protein